MSSFVHLQDQAVQQKLLQQKEPQQRHRNQKLLDLHVLQGVASLLVLVNVNATTSAFHLVTAAATTLQPVRCLTQTHAPASVELSFKEAKTASAMSAVRNLRTDVWITAKPAP